MSGRLAKIFLESGVKIIDIDSVHFLSDDVEIDANVVIEPFVVIGGKVKIGSGSIIKSFSYIEDVVIGQGVTIGPFARIRGTSHIADSARIGNFVEIKNSSIGRNSKASHLSYIGDVTLGNDCNIGAGTVFCNYDGINKHRTEISDNVFIGSNSTIVSPVVISKDSFVAAGSVINKNVADGDLAIARSAQVNKPGYAKKLLKKNNK